MKVKIEDIKDNGFKSFRVVLDIESIQESRELFCRFVLDVDDLKGTINRGCYDMPKDRLSFDKDNTVKLYGILCSKLEEYE